MVECGGLENRFTRNPRNEGSNPSSSASEQGPGNGAFLFSGVNWLSNHYYGDSRLSVRFALGCVEVRAAMRPHMLGVSTTRGERP